jgi:hypothetical protein
MREMVTIYMPLEGEGTDVWVPVSAQAVGGMRYLVGGPAPADQHWRFAPGTVVEGVARTFQDGITGVAAIGAVS